MKCAGGLLLAISLAGSAEMSTESDRPLPLGLIDDHLNLVYSVSDRDATERFYGDILGLDRISDVDMPGDSYMVRFIAGESELKFLSGGETPPTMDGDLLAARGLRSLTLHLPEERRAGIVARIEKAGIAVPEFSESDTGPIRFSRGTVQDFDGNPVEIVFSSQSSPDAGLDQMQIGLGVSDMAATGEFLRSVLTLEPIETQGDVHRYRMGKTQIKFWHVPVERPAWVGRPDEMLGMSMLQFVVDDVPAARDLVASRGGKILAEPFELGDLAVLMFVEGPDGIVIEFGATLVR